MASLLRRALTTRHVEETEMTSYRHSLELSPTQRQDLIRYRDHDPRPFVRERCAAMLKIADGVSPHAVAHHGLLKPRDPDTIYRWLRRYDTMGIAGLLVGQHGGDRRSYL